MLQSKPRTVFGIAASMLPFADLGLSYEVGLLIRAARAAGPLDQTLRSVGLDVYQMMQDDSHPLIPVQKAPPRQETCVHGPTVNTAFSCALDVIRHGTTDENKLFRAASHFRTHPPDTLVCQVAQSLCGCCYTAAFEWTREGHVQRVLSIAKTAGVDTSFLEEKWNVLGTLAIVEGERVLAIDTELINAAYAFMTRNEDRDKRAEDFQTARSILLGEDAALGDDQ